MHPRCQFAQDLVKELVDKVFKLSKKNDSVAELVDDPEMVDLEDTELPDFEALEEQRRLEEEAHMTLVNAIELDEQVEGGFRILTWRSFDSSFSHTPAPCAAEIRRQQNIPEIQEKFNELFKEDIEEKERK